MFNRVDGDEADFFVISESDAGKIMEFWHIDPSKLLGLEQSL